MALPTGARVGDYIIKGSLGRGGMSEVYRARDQTLERDVAVKVLPESLGLDAEKRARFEREAQLLAALNHKNIAVIHGLEHDGELWFLVLEFLDGETLAERLQRGRLDLSEARRVFVQIAHALEAAHAKGIIHRDLKPANVNLAPDGTVKLLDFGLGKELQRPGSAKKTATFDGLMTSPGLVMGTPGYMSPEQTRGRETAQGTDIWSFGVTLFEAVTGEHPFARETVPDMLSAILNDDPPWEKLPEGLPNAWRKLLRRTLEKNAENRIHSIADVRIELAEAPTEPDPAPPAPMTTARGIWLGLALLIPLVAWAGWQYLDHSGAAEPVIRRFVLELPPTAPISIDGTSALEISPDGTRLVYASRSSNGPELHLRALDQLGTVKVPGTQGGVAPFFGPTSDALGFFTDTQLSTVSLPGGTPVALAAVSTPRGASWAGASPGNGIYFAAESSSGLSRVSTKGGAVETVTRPDGDRRSHRWPQLLPGGKTALITLWDPTSVSIGVANLHTGRVETLIANGAFARYVPSGHIVFVRDGNLFASTFDPDSNQIGAPPVLVLEGVAHDPLTGAGFFDITSDGALFYVAAEDELPSPARMLSVSRDGSAVPIGPPRPSIQMPRWSPDGGFVLSTVQSGEGSDIWSLHLNRESFTRLTFDGASAVAVWHPSGQRIAYSTSRDGVFAIESIAADGSGTAQRLVVSEDPVFPASYSPSGDLLAYTRLHPESGLDIWLWSSAAEAPEPFLATSFSEAGARFSRDGTLIAYTSNASGRDEVYVRTVDTPAGRWQVSTESGTEPSWSRDGKELYFRSGSSLMVVDVIASPGFEASKPRPLLDAPFDEAGGLYASYDASPTGRKFVMIRSEENPAADRIHVILHWLAELERRVPRP